MTTQNSLELDPTADTLPKLLLRNYKRWGDQVAMLKKSYGIWQHYTWKDSYGRVKYLSLGLVALGLEFGDKVCILGDTDPQWYWTEYAVQAAGGVVVGLFQDAIPEELKYIIAHSESKFFFASDQEQVDKALVLKKDLPLIKKIIYWDPKGLVHYDDPILISYQSLLKLGKEYERSHPGAFEQNVSRGRGEDTALLCYTSGTTGLPKGVIMPHKSLIIDTMQLSKHFGKVGPDNNLISVFPGAWIGEQLWGIALHLVTGVKACFAEETETVESDMREIAPVVAALGPRQWEDILASTQVKTSDAGAIKRTLYNLSLPIGYRMADYKMRDMRPNLLWRALYFIAKMVVFRPLLDKFGLLKTSNPWTGSAALSPDNVQFLYALGVPLRNTYAVTEGGGFITAHSVDDVRFETAGRPLLGEEVRISNNLEVLLRGVTLTGGYYKDEQKTKEAYAGGWFHTGDAGHIDEDSHLVYIDRLSELGELATGDKYSPTYLEGKLKFSPYIKDTMVIGGKERDYVSAIINIDFANIGKWAEDHGLAFTTFADLSQKPEVSELILKHISKVNQALPKPSRIRKFVCLHKEFDPDEGELTRTRKLRRAFMEQRYHELIDAIYQDKQELKVEASVTYRDGRKGVTTTAVKIRQVEGVAR